jgi:hypothetical protein
MNRKTARSFAHHVVPPIPQTLSHCRKRTFPPPPEIPTEPRLLCSELITLRVDGTGQDALELAAILEEISPHSACVQLEEPIQTGASIRLLFTESAEGGNLRGSVVECVLAENLGYFAEVLFVPGCTWSPSRYRPLHLFDPTQRIAAKGAAGGV